jgi:hypothetical protein
MSALLPRLVRVLKIGAVAGVVIAAVRALRGNPSPPATGQAKWLPLADDPPAEPRSGPVQFTAATPTADTDADSNTDADAKTWVAPVDGTCPATHPIKGNADSGIFHVPGGRSYERTTPERCYTNEADAEADGFRRAKR